MGNTTTSWELLREKPVTHGQQNHFLGTSQRKACYTWATQPLLGNFSEKSLLHMGNTTTSWELLREKPDTHGQQNHFLATSQRNDSRTSGKH
jgi:hypothetical protein